MTTSHPKSLRKRIVMVASMLPVIFVLCFGGCKSNPAAGDDDNSSDNSTPRTPVPAELVGAWYAGTVSSVDYYNPITGARGAPSGTGVHYKFTADGSYEKGVLLQTTLYNCTKMFYAYNKGTMTVEDDKIVLYPTYGRIKSVDYCFPQYNYEKPDNLESETILWQLGHDDYDVETMSARYPGGDPSAFHRR